MILYVDETECPEYFIVTGLLVNSKQDVELAYKRFKKYAQHIAISPKKKSDLFAEFKSTLMDKHYQKAKIIMLKELNQIRYAALYSVYAKKGSTFSQIEKESAYIKLISKIVSSIKYNIDIVFDRFNIAIFEANIVENLMRFDNVNSVRPADSEKESGIKFADNLCSVVRLQKTQMDEYSFYPLISCWTKEI